jgi:hypothetical protein
LWFLITVRSTMTKKFAISLNTSVVSMTVYKSLLQCSYRMMVIFSRCQTYLSSTLLSWFQPNRAVIPLSQSLVAPSWRRSSEPWVPTMVNSSSRSLNYTGDGWGMD